MSGKAVPQAVWRHEGEMCIECQEMRGCITSDDGLRCATCWLRKAKRLDWIPQRFGAPAA